MKRFAAIPLLLVAGCYTSGLKFPASAQRIAVPVFGNDTYERGIEVPLTDRVRQILIEQSDCRLVGTTSQADAVIKGKVVRVEYPVLVAREQTGILEGSAAVAVEAELIEVKTGRVLARVGGSDVAEFTTTLGENRGTAVAAAIEELSWKIVLGLSQRSGSDSIASSRPEPRPRR